MLTIVDDLVSVDTLIEERLMEEPINEYVQSCDIVAFNKICKSTFRLFVCNFIIATRAALFLSGITLNPNFVDLWFPFFSHCRI